MDQKKLGVLAAAAAGALLTATPALSGPKMVKGHYCQNNSCKGKSACGGMGNKNGCAGQNECKGKGWLKASSKEACKKAGGKWMKAKNKKKPAQDKEG